MEIILQKNKDKHAGSATNDLYDFVEILLARCERFATEQFLVKTILDCFELSIRFRRKLFCLEGSVLREVKRYPSSRF